MALKQQQQTKRPSPGLQTQGPVNWHEEAMPGGANPPNPSDAIFQGRALPVRGPQDVTQRRDFSIPIKPTLHYRDGLDGAAETVTVNERRFFGSPKSAEGESDVAPYATGREDWDHAEEGQSTGPESMAGGKGRDGANGERTTNGVLIYGT